MIQVKSFQSFFESNEPWETDVILFINVRLFPKDLHEFPATDQRTLVAKIDPITKKIAEFINFFNRQDSKTKIEAQWNKYKENKPSISYISGQEIRQYVYWDRNLKKLRFKPEKIEKYLEMYFDVENKVQLQKSPE